MGKEKLISLYKKYKWLIRAAVMALLPLLCCFAACRMQGRSIGEVYLPSGEWNDELFYFKQVEGILSHGFPQGYFGFNESHAMKLSFAAWSPVLVFPWILWGLVFGWNLMSPIYCNIVLMMLAMFFFVLLVKPDNKQLGILTLLFCLFTPFTRYMLSGMPEVICFSMLIIFYGLAVSWLEERKAGWKLILLFLIASLLTLMRPYMVLFLVLPVFLWIRQDKSLKSIAGSTAVLVVTLGLYAAIKHYLGAEYFTPLFKTEWATKFLTDGFLAGCKNVVRTLLSEGRDFTARTVESFLSGLAEGAIFAAFLAILLILLWQTLAAFRKKKENQVILYGHMALSFLGMLAALLLMYKLKEGSKHLLTFIAAGIFIVSMMETRFFKKAAVLGALFAFLFTVKATAAYDYQIPFAQEERVQEVEYWRQLLEEEMELSTQNVPDFRNVVIWVFGDTIPEDGSTELTSWQNLYALPKGFGISCCYGEYVMENLTELESRYLATVPGGMIDRQCREEGYREVGRRSELVIYERYR